MKHSIALSGSYSGGDIEKILKCLPKTGVLQMSLVGREITLQVRSGRLDEVKDSLKTLGVNNINVLEWKKSGVTLSGSGRGESKDKSVVVSFIPSALDEGLKALAFMGAEGIDEKFAEKAGAKVEDILREAGVTDAMYTIQIKKKASEKRLLEDLTLASLDAIFEAGGVADIE
ncbi:MAG: hypothetical protein WAX07_03250 [Candidatus Altiarchaeia archaeon]|jgi:hypothetical protein